MTFKKRTMQETERAVIAARLFNQALQCIADGDDAAAVWRGTDAVGLLYHNAGPGELIGRDLFTGRGFRLVEKGRMEEGARAIVAHLRRLAEIPGNERHVKTAREAYLHAAEHVSHLIR